MSATEATTRSDLQTPPPASVTPRVLLSPPDVGALEEGYVLEAVRSGWVAPAGPHLQAFEAGVAERTGRRHAVALSSGTAALHLSLVVMGVRPGDVVLVPTLTFVATPNAVVYTGAEPCFVDVDRRSGNLSPELVADAVRTLRREGRRVAAVIPVDLFGKCAEYDELSRVCDELGVSMVEDAAESLGARHLGRAAGSFGAAAAVSFNGNKIMTTGGGGAFVTDDAQMAHKVRHLSTQAREPVNHYEHREVGYNYRLSNILAALGLAQLERLDSMIERRRMIRTIYRRFCDRFAGVDLFGDDANSEEDNCWLSVISVDRGVAGWRPEHLAAHLEANGIETRPVWKPMHQQPVFAGHRSFLTGAANGIYAKGLVLPSGSVHDRDAIDRVCAAAEEFITEGVVTYVGGARP